MQRVLSVQAIHSDNSSTEFVTKRLCFSVLFTVAFFSLLGGYFLGRYATERLQQQQATLLEEISGKISQLHQNIYNKYKEETINCNCEEPTIKLKCNNSNVPIKNDEAAKYALSNLQLCFR